MARRCPKCQNVSDNDRVCTVCGFDLRGYVAAAALGRQCARCGRVNAPEARWCTKCGAGLAGAPLVARGRTGERVRIRGDHRPQPVVLEDPASQSPSALNRILIAVAAVFIVCVVFAVASAGTGGTLRINALGISTVPPSVRTGAEGSSGPVQARVAPSRGGLYSLQSAMAIYEGAGSDTTPEFSLQDGIAIFDLHCEGNEAFSVRVVDKGGTLTLVDIPAGRGDFDGVVAWSVSKAGNFALKPGSYTLGIETGGRWSVGVAQPRPNSGRAVPLTLTGTGTAVTEPFSLETGSYTFRMKNESPFVSSGFTVRLVRLDGTREEVIASGASSPGKSAAVTRSVTLRPNEAGLYLLSVRADGNWSVGVQ